MSRFAYFDYSGKLPPTIYSAYREPYHYVVGISKKESDGHDRTPDELQKAAAILIRNTLGPTDAETLIATPGQTEITREELELMRTRRVNLSSIMPGGVYEVLPRYEP